MEFVMNKKGSKLCTLGGKLTLKQKRYVTPKANNSGNDASDNNNPCDTHAPVQISNCMAEWSITKE